MSAGQPRRGAAGRVLGAALRLGRATRRYLRNRGVAYTLRRTLWWIGTRLSGRPVLPPAAVPPGGLEVLFEFDPAAAGRCELPAEGRWLVQEIPLAVDELHSIEVMAESRGSERQPVIFMLLAESGDHLAQGSLQLPTGFDNGYARVPLPAALHVAGSDRVYLALRVAGGAGARAPLFWLAAGIRGRCWRDVPAAADAVLIAQLPPPALDQALVYRLTARNRLAEPRYRWPRPPQPALDAPRALLLGAWPEAPAALRAVEDVATALTAVRDGTVQALFVADMTWSDAIAELLRACHEAALPSVYVASGAALTVLPFEPPLSARKDSLRDPNAVVAARLRTMVACDLVLPRDPQAATLARADRKPLVPAADGDCLQHALAAYRALRRPRVSIVTLLYNKARELPFVLPTYAGQSYDGEFEFVFVDDCTADDSVAVVEHFAGELAAGPLAGRMSVKLVRNPANLGNCASRNRGLAAASGEILVVIDADCMLNRDFVLRHVDAHAFGDCEVVVGPLNIETHDEPPHEVLARFEADPALAAPSAGMQDHGNRASFLNCITRNFSIRRSALPADGPLFDPLFGYSADPTSGFGWEDVEMGYRLYCAGARIKFVAEAFSIHCSAPPAPEGRKPLRSLLNFRRLLEKHPQFAGVAPRWTRETYARILDWCERLGLDPGEHRAAVDRLLHQAPPAGPLLRTGQPRLRVLTCRWHVPHQYELWKLPVDVTLVTGTGSGMCDRWDYGQRPLPANARFRPLEEIRAEDYDLAILHFDENVLAPQNTQGVIGPEWGAAFKLLRERFDLPKIAVCHGTPQFHGQYDFDYTGADLMQPIESERRRLVDYLGDIPVVCNSYQAQQEWGFRRSTVIWHGFDPAEFGPATRERGIVSALGPLVLSRPHYRGYFLYRQVFDGCWNELRPETLRVPEPHPSYVGNGYARAKFQRYVGELRRYSVYFNPTLRSPMPRARGEPMMCGVVTVSARNHDVDRFIDNGVDGFHASEAGELREQLRFLMRDPTACERIGAAARAKAIKVFHVERYLQDWQALIRASV